MLEKEEKVEDVIKVSMLPIDIKNGKTYIIEQANPNSYTHNFFKYPCKFIPEIPRWAIKKYAQQESSIILDPFSGSGTTLLESMVNNHIAIGTEIDELAKLLIKVKTTPFTKDQIIEAKKCSKEIIDNLYRDNVFPIIAHINNIEHWFPIDSIDKLGRFRYLIQNIEDRDIRDLMMICFASIIKKCSYADDVSPKPYVSSKVLKIPKEPIEEFMSIFNKYIKGIQELSDIEKLGSAQIIEGDALQFNTSEKVKLAITSPPYINAFDYGRTLRLENLWLGLITEQQLRDKKKKYVGTEKIKIEQEEENLSILQQSELLGKYFEKILEVDKKRAYIMKRFFEDMKINLEKVYNSLDENGIYCIVIGNSTIRNIEVESWKVLEDIGKNIGFSVDAYFNYIIQNPYIRIPRGSKGGKINKDYVLVLKKIKGE